LIHPVIGNSNRGPKQVVAKSPDAITSLSLAESKGAPFEPLVLGFAQWHSDVAVIVTQRHRVEDDHHRLERAHRLTTLHNFCDWLIWVVNGTFKSTLLALFSSIPFSVAIFINQHGFAQIVEMTQSMSNFG